LAIPMLAHFTGVGAKARALCYAAGLKGLGAR
jgi:hypothetical protein